MQMPGAGLSHRTARMNDDNFVKTVDSCQHSRSQALQPTCLGSDIPPAASTGTGGLPLSLHNLCTRSTASGTKERVLA